MKKAFFVFRRIETYLRTANMPAKKRGGSDNLLVGQDGFTLLELLIVMLIIGLLAAFVAPRMIGKVGKSKQTIAKAQIESLCTAVETYRLDTDRYPGQEEGLNALISHPANAENWSGPYLAKRNVPKDPWGNDYVYTYPGNSGDYDIVSYGADGQEGGEGEDADITSWE